MGKSCSCPLAIPILISFLPRLQSVWTHNLKPVSAINPQDHRRRISVLAFTVWLVLGRFRSALKESEKYRRALKEAESKTN